MAYPYAITGMDTQDPTKPKKPLGTWDNANQNVTLATPNQQTQPPKTAMQQGNEDVLLSAQNRVLGGAPDQMLGQVAAKTEGLLKDPNYGINYDKQKQLQLEQQNRNFNQQLETLRQQTAPQAYTGQNLRDLTNVAMQGVQQRADTARAIDFENQRAQRENLMSALAQGQSVAQQQRSAFDQDIQNLVNVRGAAEGEETRAQQMKVLDKTFLQDMEKLKATQDWQGSQNLIDRELQKELAAGNWQNAITLTQMKGDIDKQLQAQQQEFAKSERISTQGWQTSERLSEQDFQTTMKHLDIQAQKALQEGDFEKAKYLQERNELLQLKMQTNEMNQQEKMAYINSNLAEAKANGDVDRQKSILTFQHGQEMETLRETQGFEQAMQYNKDQLALAMQANDHVAAEALQRMALDAQAKENLANRALDEARIALQARGLDMQAIEQRYNILNSEIEAGRIPADSAVNFLNSQLAGTGIKLTAVNAQQAALEAMDEEYNQELYQFAKTHPEYVDMASRGLTEDGKRAFNEYFNKSVYGENTVSDIVKGIADASQLQGGATAGSKNATQYAAVLAQAQDWTPDISKDGRGFWNPDVRTINNAPEKGTYFKYNGKLYYATSGVSEETRGQNYQYFKAIDVNSGQSITIRANEGATGVQGFPGTNTNTQPTNTTQNADMWNY